MSLTAKLPARDQSKNGWPERLLPNVFVVLLIGTLLTLSLGAGMWFALGRPDLTAPPPVPAVTPTGAQPPTPAIGTPARARSLTVAERLDSVKLILAIVAGFGGVVALTVAYR